jgi:hypothetical protein
MAEYFTIIPDKICFYHVPNNDERRKIHNYMEKFHPNIKICSLTCEYFKYDTQLFYKCSTDDNDCLVKMEYRRGVMKNNKDEYYIGYCDNCNDFHIWECNYDDYDVVFTKKLGNIIAFGDYFSSYIPRKTAIKDIITKDELKNILEPKILYSINNPPKALKKQKIGEYIKSQFV